jgi:hypothetical protein
MLATHPASAPADQIFASLEQDGATIVTGLLAAPTVERLVADFTPHLDAVAWGYHDAGDPDDFSGRQTKRLHGLLARSPALGDVVGHPLLRAMCERFLRPHARDYRISTTELMVLGGGETNQMLHRDADSWRYFPKPRPEILVSANIALTDFTAKNGATVVVAGSHGWDPKRAATEAERSAAVMPRGSALLYSGNVLHGGGANETDDVRIGMYLGYLLSWLRPIENHTITNGAEVLAKLPPETQRLFDYSPNGFDLFA